MLSLCFPYIEYSLSLSFLALLHWILLLCLFLFSCSELSLSIFSVSPILNSPVFPKFFLSVRPFVCLFLYKTKVLVVFLEWCRRMFGFFLCHVLCYFLLCMHFMKFDFACVILHNFSKHVKCCFLAKQASCLPNLNWENDHKAWMSLHLNVPFHVHGNDTVG